MHSKSMIFFKKSYTAGRSQVTVCAPLASMQWHRKRINKRKHTGIYHSSFCTGDQDKMLGRTSEEIGSQEGSQPKIFPPYKHPWACSLLVELIKNAWAETPEVLYLFFTLGSWDSQCEEYSKEREELSADRQPCAPAPGSHQPRALGGLFPSLAPSFCASVLPFLPSSTPSLVLSYLFLSSFLSLFLFMLNLICWCHYTMLKQQGIQVGNTAAQCLPAKYKVMSLIFNPKQTNKQIYT